MDTKTTRIIEAARELLKHYGYYMDHLWHVDDIHFICEQKDLPKLTNQEAMQVLVIAGEQFDGEKGISWPQIERAVEIFLKKKAMMEQMQASQA